MTNPAQEAVQAYGGHSPESGTVGHIVPFWILAAVWIALMIFTYLTVSATYIDLGGMNLVLAMAIATVKASLVILFFMHLYWDKPFHALVFITALMFIALFVVIVLIDTTEYYPDLIPGYAPLMNK
ncbi:MAG TPA: cytochrome C oxidase subunit IV family protein [bacterium]|mgnify:CR=1 FL=1|nr:cytochrome C oxidase subunit IV family protein [bacterium]